MALDPCVKNIVCTLSVPVLTSLKALVEAQISITQSLLAQLQARSVTLGIQLVPIQVARDAAVAVLNESQSIANLLPLSLIEGCADLGSLQVNLTSAVQQATSAVADLADDATRTLSLQNELNLEIASLNTQLTDFNDFVTVIDECLAEAL